MGVFSEDSSFDDKLYAHFTLHHVIAHAINGEVLTWMQQFVLMELGCVFLLMCLKRVH